MTRTIVSRNIKATIDLVFKTVADITQFSRALPHIVKVEFLSDIKFGFGARFRETRLMKGKETATELKVTEYFENNLVRFVAEDHGIVWDTVFVVNREEGYTKLTVTMDAKAQKSLAKLIVFLISGTVKKELNGIWIV